MSDLVFLLVIIALFAAGAGLVALCDRIVGTVDDESNEATR